MEELKNNLKNISDESLELGKEYLRYASLTVSKKLALLGGILLSALFFSLIFLLIIILLSLMLAGILNEVLKHEFAGYLVMSGFYILLVAGLIMYIVKKRKPLFSNLLVRIFAFIFEIDSKIPLTLEHIEIEKKATLEKIDADKKMIALNLKLFKYVLLESILKEIFGLFQKNKKPTEEKSEEEA